MKGRPKGDTVPGLLRDCLEMRLTAHGGGGRLPRPASHDILPLGGRVGERAGVATKFAISRISRRTLGVTAVLAAPLLLAGCISLGGKTPKQLIRLTPEATAPAGDIGSANLRDALVVLDPEAGRRLDVERVPVQIDDATIAYLKDATWVERPARQFRRLLAETIRAKGKRIVVEAGDAAEGGKAILAGRLLDMGYDARSRSVVVRYDALREDAGGQAVSRRFEATVPGVAPKVESVAPALNKAANEVARQVADWVG
jgi:cholesterol transport system auxiliary component